MIVKEKRPQSIWMNRNQDGTYEILYQGMAIIDDENNITTGEINIPRCVIDWDDNGFLPQAKIKDILKENEDSNDLVHINYDINL